MIKNPQGWVITSLAKPEYNKVVETKNTRGDIQKGLFDGKLWWDPKKEMYWYYEPKEWRDI